MKVKDLLNKILSFCINLLASFGMLWLLVSIISYFGNDLVSKEIKNYWWLFGLIGLLYAIFKLLPKNSYEFKVPHRDAIIKIQKKNILKVEGSLIVPVNYYFKINQDGNLLTSSSILSQVVKKYYGSKPEELQFEIDQVLKENFYINYKVGEHYKIGTVVPIIKNEKKFYFLANTILNNQNKSECNDEIFEKSINELWMYLSECASKEDFIIPLIGTGNGRLKTDRVIVFQEILLSFLSSLSSKNYAESLTICFNATDIKKHKINFENIGDFSKAKIEYQDYRTRSINGKNKLN
ncbi:macro domain-containing protein [Flavobacterium aciduliphilum]|uniref:Thoeris protein ThsA Macro domain-containing protein n=1 Tax=Flavobacterium aciduliphilum TaxID=1101402 RepID=A0A328YSE1_9FLAO|nr:macro domain-containing protein [Flavobacterium aciduliphilum]RAR75685.1 hypothetical protein CLV55_101385 [Flavobacterium aciduliphilum]